MNGEIETAMRHNGDFPKRWGRPEGDKYSDERRDWILARIADDHAKGIARSKARLALAQSLELLS